MSAGRGAMEMRGGASAAEVLTPDLAIGLLERMLLIRDFEQAAYLRFLQGEIPGTLHQCQGQEAVAVGVCAALGPEDWITSTHRPHGHALAKGIDPRRAMAEIYGKATGCFGGRGGSMHLGDPSVGMLPSTAIVGGGITLAPGLALALKRRSPGAVVACFFGDGAVNEGAFHEGLNFAAVLDLPVVFVCENNLYGASTPFDRTTRNPEVAARGAAYGVPAERVDGMDVVAVLQAARMAVDRARAGEGPTLLECMCYRYLGHSRNDARGYRDRQEEEAWRARDPIDTFAKRLIDEGLAGEQEVAAARARSKQAIDEAVSFARSSEPPDPRRAADPALVYASPARPQPIAGPLPSGDDQPRLLSIAEALREGIAEELEADANLVLLGEDIGVSGGWGGAFGVYQGLAERFGRDRVIDTPISEKVLIGASVGAAVGGLRTLPDLQYSDFVFEAMDEIVNEAAKLRAMSNGALSVPMVLRCPVGACHRGAQHTQCPESLFMHVPGLKVLCISDAYTAKGAIRAALRDPDPVLVFEHKLLYGSKRRQESGQVDARSHVPADPYVLPVGQARIRRHGEHVTVLATFLQLYMALDVAEQLAADGVECEVIDPVWLSPFDWAGLYASVARTGRLVIAHEAPLTGGWSAEVAARVSEHCHGELRAPVMRLGTREVPIPFAPQLEAAVLPGRDQIRAAVLRTLEDHDHR
ncbi:MAG TPA: thiamine pyrophosphate-dependent enzyme [Solirubrobacteraceae bacterium]|nr:thiamine pyrophosphate-dependent enzyme [Solirubrobacteraceae bacterium]